MPPSRLDLHLLWERSDENRHLGQVIPEVKERHLETRSEQTGQLRAEIEHISYRNDDNGWTVLKARNHDDQALITATGFFAAVHAGAQYEFFGAWSRHPTYGPQFKIERMVPIRPDTAATIERYLASGLIKGIGPKTATRIVEHFGIDTLDVLDREPKRLGEIASLGKKKIVQIIKSWQEQRTVADVMMFLNTHSISPLFAARIHRHYGPDAIKIVSADPYQLANDISGIGFIVADRIAQSMGIAADSIERMRAAIIYQLQQGEERGHCYITKTQLIRMLSSSLNISDAQISPRIDEALDHLEKVGAIATEPLEKTEPNSEDQLGYYRSDLLVAEWNVTRAAARLLDVDLSHDPERIEAWISRYAEASGTMLADEQLDAVRKAASNRLFVLTGGPGVGKTTTANTIIRLLKAMGKTVALAAPTGRAAQRLTEVAATPARTIHRMLEWLPHLHRFARDETNPLPVQAVIVDEASMLDIRLADALFRAVPPTAQLILIGDVDQLPSVGPGNVLRDLIDCPQVPCTRLSRVFRQAQCSRIIQTAHVINGGGTPDFASMGDLSDCQFIDADTGDDIREKVLELVEKRIPREFNFDPVSDVQVLTPMNRGELGTIALNEALQRALNPEAPHKREFKRGSLLLRQGDKVIQSVNNYDLGVFNGDIGYVRDTRVEGGRLLIAFGDDKLVTYDEEQALDLRLAYAITVHKSQGSEFPVVVIPCTMQHYVMLQRNLMYTALTRARKLAIFVGASKALQFAINNQTSGQRQTGLNAKLRAET